MWDIHRKIRYYREKAGLSYEQLAAADGVNCTWQSAQQWEQGPTGNKKATAPRRTRLKAVAKALKTTEAELNSPRPPIDSPPDGDEKDKGARDAQEEMLLHLFRGLFAEQKRDLIIEQMALFDANNYTREQLKVKVLKGVTNAEVRAAFGDVADLVRQEVAKRKKRHRSIDPHPGDPDAE